MVNKELLVKILISDKDRLKELKLPAKETCDLAYLCGIFVGDGSIYTRVRKHDYILKCVGNPKDEKKLYLDVIGPCFKRVFGFLPNIRYQDSNTTFGFIIYSKALFEYLTKIIKLPSGKKYKSLHIPKIFNKDRELLIDFIRGVMDTDGSISFKKRYRSKPYYPVITLSSKSRGFIEEVTTKLKELGFSVAELYDYKVIDKRVKKGFTIINRIDLNGKENLKRYLRLIGFKSPKHLAKIKKVWKE